MNAIDVKHLTKRYGAFAAVDDVTFGLEPGVVLALLGPNGAGKTTTIEMLEGFLDPSGGEVRVLGTDPRHGGRQWRARIGLVLQSTSLDPQITVWEVLNLFARLFPQPLPVVEVLEIVDLTDDAGVRIGVLSGGQRRRVDLGLGIIGRPELLFLDEPTTGLDPGARRGIWAGIERLKSAGTSVLLTTHYLDEAAQLADRIIVLANGKVVADTTPAAMRTRGGLTTIRYHVPDGVPLSSLPAPLTDCATLDDRDLVIRCADVTQVLDSLVCWARRHQIDLSGLEVGPPSLEDAYLAITGESRGNEDIHHG
jgi:ABC-2 type transport system ATP-binding protein